ncbi:MAG: hypothetical protein KAH18_07925 [Psychromonas sp.]|nr:hypothetical protein [Psychromonas sp.]
MNNKSKFYGSQCIRHLLKLLYRCDVKKQRHIILEYQIKTPHSAYQRKILMITALFSYYPQIMVTCTNLVRYKMSTHATDKY